MKQGKVWGTTELLLSNSSLELHRIEFKKGFRCSKHKHESKYNLFYVISGVMKVKVYQKDYNLVDETILKGGEFTAVKPGLYHEFIGMESGEALEIYWSELNPNDIIREDHGGYIGSKL